MFLNLFPFICTRCLLWRSALLYALRLAVAYPYAALLIGLALALAWALLSALYAPVPLSNAEVIG